MVYKSKFKLNVDFTYLEVALETMDHLYRTRSEAEARVKHLADTYNRSAKIIEVQESVGGRPARHFFKVVDDD